MYKKHFDEIFKEYDIRGLYPDQMDEEFFRNLGRAYVTLFKTDRVAVAHDIKVTSHQMKYALIDGILNAGCNVVDLGEIATEMMYFAVGRYSDYLDGGLIVTASHNPAMWVGCKMVRKNVLPVGYNTGLEDIKKIMLNDNYESLSENPGLLGDLDIYPAFKEKVLSFINPEKKKNLKLVVDAGNGIGGKIFNYVFDGLDFDVTRLYFVPDGTYPHHVPDPLKEENVKNLQNLVVMKKADLGIAFDGDADRVFFIDKKGRKPSGAYTGCFIARYLLHKHPGEKVLHDPRITWPMSKEIQKMGGIPVLSKAGHSNFKQKIRDVDALFGAEMSSHYFYRDFYYADSGLISVAIMLQMLFEDLDFEAELDYLYEKYPNSGEVNYVVREIPILLDKIENHYAELGGKILKVDGLSIEFEDWRFNLRESNTQSLLRLNVEGVNKDKVVEKFYEVEKLIGAKRDNKPALEEIKGISSIV